MQDRDETRSFSSEQEALLGVEGGGVLLARVMHQRDPEGRRRPRPRLVYLGRQLPKYCFLIFQLSSHPSSIIPLPHNHSIPLLLLYFELCLEWRF
jgi:hypothetical protein